MEHFLILLDGDRWRFIPKLRRQVKRQLLWNSCNPDYQRNHRPTFPGWAFMWTEATQRLWKLKEEMILKSVCGGGGRLQAFHLSITLWLWIHSNNVLMLFSGNRKSLFAKIWQLISKLRLPSVWVNGPPTGGSCKCSSSLSCREKHELLRTGNST